MPKAKPSQIVPPQSDPALEIRAAFAHLRDAIDALEAALLRSSREPEPAGLPSDAEPEVMKPSAYAHRLRVGVRKVHKWIEQGMPHFKIEGRVRIRVREADEWFATRGSNP